MSKRAGTSRLLHRQERPCQVESESNHHHSIQRMRSKSQELRLWYSRGRASLVFSDPFLGLGQPFGHLRHELRMLEGFVAGLPIVSEPARGLAARSHWTSSVTPLLIRNLESQL